MEFFKSKGQGQFFKRVGSRVVIVCKYDFNPGIEVTRYDAKLCDALGVTPCSEQAFDQAFFEVQESLASFAAGMAVAA